MFKLLYLFKSEPDMFVLEFPTDTPSGFTIGTILKIKNSLNFAAIGSFDRRKVMRPLQMRDDGVS